MSPGSARAAAFGMGVVAGLRSLLAPAVLVWSAQKNFIDRDFPLATLVSRPASRKMIKLAAGELVADKLPFTPKRISPGPFAARLASGAAISFLAKQSPIEGVLLGSAGAFAGAVGGYYARRSLSRNHSAMAVALVEDALAITLAMGILRQVSRRA